MDNSVKNKKYDLEERTLIFAKNVRNFLRKTKKSICNMEDIKQVIRSSGSVGANYREANDSLSKKDFVMRIKICRKEAKETIYWLEIIDVEDKFSDEKESLKKEATELMKIFGAILQKSEK